MRADLINAKSYKVSFKILKSERNYRTETYTNLDEATAKYNEYKSRGYDTTIRGIK